MWAKGTDQIGRIERQRTYECMSSAAYRETPEGKSNESKNADGEMNGSRKKIRLGCALGVRSLEI